MKRSKMVLLISMAFLTMGAAQAKGGIFYTAPFHNVEVKPASKIYVDYSFDPHREVLICKSDKDNSAITSIEWVYKDATRKIDLPVKLKDDRRVTDGYLADPEGKLVITNDFGADINGSIFVTCEKQKF